MNWDGSPTRDELRADAHAERVQREAEMEELLERMMNSEYQLHLDNDDEWMNVKRHARKEWHWIQVGPITIFGSARQLDDLIDQLAALRTKEPA